MQAASPQDAAETCARLYDGDCDEPCAAWSAGADAWCALELDDPQLEGFRDINDNPGEYVCGCACAAD